MQMQPKLPLVRHLVASAALKVAARPFFNWKNRLPALKFSFGSNIIE